MITRTRCCSAEGGGGTGAAGACGAAGRAGAVACGGCGAVLGREGSQPDTRSVNKRQPGGRSRVDFMRAQQRNQPGVCKRTKGTMPMISYAMEVRVAVCAVSPASPWNN